MVTNSEVKRGTNGRPVRRADHTNEPDQTFDGNRPKSRKERKTLQVLQRTQQGNTN